MIGSENPDTIQQQNLLDYWSEHLQNIELPPFEDIEQRQRVDFQDFTNHFQDYNKLTTEWVILEYDLKETFFKDHEVVLINLHYNSYISKDRNRDNEYKYLELPDSDGHIIDFKNMIVINMSTYQTN